MNIRSSSLSSNQRSFPTDHILARDRETSKLTMLMQPSNMQASVPGVARQWIVNGQYYHTNMEAGKYSSTIQSFLQNRE